MLCVDQFAVSLYSFLLVIFVLLFSIQNQLNRDIVSTVRFSFVFLHFIRFSHDFLFSTRPRYGNSWRSILLVLPFIIFTALCIPNCGSTSISKWIWSGITSISIISTCISWQISFINSFNLLSTPLTRILRLYLGQHTTWYLQEYTTIKYLIQTTFKFCKKICGLYPHS